MVANPQKYYSPEEYLALEETAEYRSEYYRGEIFAMAGGSANHNRIAGNIYLELRETLEGKSCEAFITDMRLHIKKNSLYTYPDVMVVCGRIEYIKGRTDTLTNPVVIIEVLSDSTQAYDRGAKFELYRAIESLQDYVLVDQARVHVEYFHKLEDGRWLLEEFNELEAVLRLEAVNVELPLSRVYQRVEWES
ncbi:MAG: Uma2 family endonuclease [Anaerolineae bacterium]|nr:Uma2 family endonuclease [Anaerolineales bacterium]MCQ3979012.1 Uma2 family endonuclease [Anaerolineae bacterium]